MYMLSLLNLLSPILPTQPETNILWDKGGHEPSQLFEFNSNFELKLVQLES